MVYNKTVLFTATEEIRFSKRIINEGEKMEIKTVKTKKSEIEYFTFGKGSRIMVILPGVSVQSIMQSASFVASAYSCFSKSHTVYLFDRAKNLEKDCTVGDMAEDTVEAMKELGICDADLFGTSQGGMMAMYIAANYPELVHKLALGSTAARLNSECRKILRNWVKLAEAGNIVMLNRDITEKVFSPSFVEEYRDFFKFKEGIGTADEMKRFSCMVSGTENFDIYDRLDDIKCPVFVIGADEDRVVSGEASKEIAEKLGCELYIYKGYGHAVYDEANDYKNRLMNFFS